MDAVKDDYTDRPPEDMSAIRKNISLIREVMDPKKDEEYKLVDFLEKTTDEIYRCNTFTSFFISIYLSIYIYLYIYIYACVCGV